MARLLEELPDLGTPPWPRVTTLARLHQLHHQLLALLVDLVTYRGDDDVAQGWLKTFGYLLTPDETALLMRAATTEQRISNLNWKNPAGRELNADEREEDESDIKVNNAERIGALSPHQMLAALADTYRQTVLDLLDRTRE